MKKKIAIFVISYKSVNLIIQTINRIQKEVIDKVEEIYVIDDYSKDNTYYAIKGYKVEKNLDKLNVYVNNKNLGYGGNQKTGYDYAIKKGYDIVVMLHGDGQYPPEQINELLGPLENDEADMVFGSRINTALKGNMPLYKYFGNKLLSFIENKFLKTSLSEFHSGFRLYNCHALKQVNYHECSNDFEFDTDIIIKFVDKKLRIVEKPIPTYYGDEISHVKPFRYGFNCLKSVFKYWKSNRSYKNKLTK